jgi:hypothetical protein
MLMNSGRFAVLIMHLARKFHSYIFLSAHSFSYLRRIPFERFEIWALSTQQHQRSNKLPSRDYVISALFLFRSLVTASGFQRIQ